MKYINLITVISLSAFAISCSSGSSSDSTMDANDASISGKVLGSYIQGALLCIDENENGRCDTTDTHTITSSSDGSYLLENLSAELFQKPIVVEVPQGATIVDPVSGATSTASTEYRLNYPPSSNDSRFISSLSTLVNSEYLKTNNLAAATESVTSKLNTFGVPVTSSTLLGNYVEVATASNATSSEVELYNVAKLAGETMQVVQESTADSPATNMAALFALVAEKVFETMDVIEQVASNNQTLIGETQAQTTVSSLAQNYDLSITAEDVTAAEELDNATFPIGTVDYVNVLNQKEESAPGTWKRVTYVRFNMPSQENELSVDEYRSQIPDTYEIGILDSTGTLILTNRFDDMNEDEAASKRTSYYFEDDNTVFSVWTIEDDHTAAVGDYSYVLCTQLCESTEGRIALDNASVAPYDNTIDVDNMSALTSILQNNLQVYTSDDGTFSSNDQQRIFVSQPSPSHGSTYRIAIGVDADSEGVPAEKTSVYTNQSLNAGKTIPQDWITSNKAFVASIQHRDAHQYRDISWIVTTDYQPITLEKRSSFAVDEIFDIYLGDYDLRYSNTANFREGLDSSFRFYLSEDNTLTSLHFEDVARNNIADICLPSDGIPSAQADLAEYGASHEDDGSSDYFVGCQNESLNSSFNLNGTDKSAQVSLRSSTDRRTGTKEILEVSVYLLQNDSNGQWGETSSVIDSMAYAVAGFADGSSQSYPMDLVKPSNSFADTGNAAVNVCSVDANNIRVSWTPPSGLLSDFQAGQLSVNLGIYGRAEDGTRLIENTIRTQIGATSTVVPKSLLSSSDGSVIDRFDIRAAIGDMSYYSWKHRTYWVKVWEQFTPAEVINAANCP